jgi:hypothetical protein
MDGPLPNAHCKLRPVLSSPRKVTKAIPPRSPLLGAFLKPFESASEPQAMLQPFAVQFPELSLGYAFRHASSVHDLGIWRKSARATGGSLPGGRCGAARSGCSRRRSPSPAPRSAAAAGSASPSRGSHAPGSTLGTRRDTGPLRTQRHGAGARDTA